MSDKKATKTDLVPLFNAFTKILQNMVDNAGEEGLTASNLSVIRQFLKDNGMEADIESSKPLQNLAAVLPFPDTATG